MCLKSLVTYLSHIFLHGGGSAVRLHLICQIYNRRYIEYNLFPFRQLSAICTLWWQWILFMLCGPALQKTSLSWQKSRSRKTKNSRTPLSLNTAVFMKRRDVSVTPDLLQECYTQFLPSSKTDNAPLLHCVQVWVHFSCLGVSWSSSLSGVCHSSEH